MIIAQITDLHVVAKDQLCYGRVDTNAQLREAVAHINTLQPRPDVVIASGDLTDNGARDEYETLKEIIMKLIPPLYMIPGNHDNRDVFMESFTDQTYLPLPGAAFAYYAIDDYPVRLIGMDTTIPNRHNGMLCAERLNWLEETLRAEPTKPTLIFMHHPPFRTGIRWMDAYGLHGGHKMQEIVLRHRQVGRVICGHIHRSIQVSWGKTIACTCPSTCHQVALNLTGTGGFDLIMEPRSVNLHILDQNYGFVSHLSYVSKEYESFKPISELENWTLDDLLELIKRKYDKICYEEFDL